MEQDLAKQSRSAILKEVIGQRYAQDMKQTLERMNIKFTQNQIQSDGSQSLNTLFEIDLPQQVTSKQAQFYFSLLKKFYEVRKVLNPQLTFETFLSQYNQQIDQKIQRYQLESIVAPSVQSHNLNSLIVKNELALMKSETIKMVLEKREEIQQLESKSEEVNKEYNQRVKDLIEKNVHLNIKNIEYQLKLKEHQITKKQKATKIYLPSSTVKNKAQSKDAQCKFSKKSSINEQKREEVERIKVVVNNNMWGWGDKIHERLKKLKQLKQEVEKS